MATVAKGRSKPAPACALVPPSPVQDEQARLAALVPYRRLDAAPEPEFDRLAALAARMVGAPMALISLVDADHVWLKASVGVALAKGPRLGSLCDEVVSRGPGAVMVVGDARLDPRLRDHALVAAGPVRFCVGVAITSPDGHNLGALCVLDRKPRRRPPARVLEQLSALAGVVADALELRRAGLEQAAAAAEHARRAETAESLARLGHWRIDLPSGKLSWSSQMYRIYGLPVGAPLSLDVIRTMIHPEDREMGDARLQQMLSGEVTGEVCSLSRMLRPDGQLLWMELRYTAERDAAGQVTAVLGAMIDITDRVAAEAALAASEARYRGLADAAPEIISECALDGTMLYLSPACETITGIKPEVAIGASVFDTLKPQDALRMRAAFKAIVDSGGKAPSRALQFQFNHQDGRTLWLECRPSGRFDPATGALCGVIDVIRDITAHKALEEELQRARAEAEAAAAVKGEFLANMSHELRTPLTSVLGFTRLALEQPELSPETRGFIEKASHAGKALLTTVNDILDFSKLEAGQLEIRPQPCDPAQVCAQTLALFSEQAGTKGLILDLVADDLPPSVDIDPDRLRQVLLNLLGNAVKFSDAGKVTLAAFWGVADETLSIWISDQGPGLSPEQQACLFRRFSQVDGSSTRRHGGTGLGLAICRGLVEAMGGVIGVESAEGRGSRFHFSLPAPRTAPPKAEPAAPAIGIVPGARVLVVDDHAANRELVRAILVPLGAVVAEARDGAEAVTAAARTAFDIILMDLRMPELDGMGAMRAIRAGGGVNADVPILAFSAGTDTGGEAERLAAGFSGDLGKPLMPAELILAIARHISPWMFQGARSRAA